MARALEGGVVDRVQHRIIIVGDGDRIIGEAAVGAAHLRAGKHEHLRLSGQHRIHNDVLSGEKLRVQIGLRAKAALFAVLRHAAAVRGEEVEGGAAGLLLHLVQTGTDLFFARGVFQKIVPQMQQHLVSADQMVQHIVGFTQDLRQMRGALPIDRLRHKQEIPIADAAEQHRQSQQCGGRAAPFFQEAVFYFASACFICHFRLPQCNIIFRLRQYGIPLGDIRAPSVPNSRVAAL